MQLVCIFAPFRYPAKLAGTLKARIDCCGRHMNITCRADESLRSDFTTTSAGSGGVNCTGAPETYLASIRLPRKSLLSSIDICQSGRYALLDISSRMLCNLKLYSEKRVCAAAAKSSTCLQEFARGKPGSEVCNYLLSD